MAREPWKLDPAVSEACRAIGYVAVGLVSIIVAAGFMVMLFG